MDKSRSKITRMSKLNQQLGATDRRRSRRFRFRWEITIRRIDSTGKIYSNAGELKNLSSGGSYMILAQSLNIGDKIEICIRLPLQRENWMRYSGEVIRLQKRGSKARVGIEFDKSRPEFLKTRIIQKMSASGSSAIKRGH